MWPSVFGLVPDFWTACFSKHVWDVIYLTAIPAIPREHVRIVPDKMC